MSLTPVQHDCPFCRCTEPLGSFTDDGARPSLLRVARVILGKLESETASVTILDQMALSDAIREAEKHTDKETYCRPFFGSGP